MPRSPWQRTALALGVAGALLFPLPVLGGAAAARAAAARGQLTWGAGADARAPDRAVEVTAPRDSHLPQGTGLYVVACPARRACLAGGNYENRGGEVEAMVASQARGRWLPARPLALPANAARQPYAQVKGIACAGARFCVAVGDYVHGPGRTMGAFLATWSHGTWRRAFTPRLPADAAARPWSRLAAVACTAGGFCEAVGSYTDRAGHVQGMALAKLPGLAWGRAVQIAPPLHAAAHPDVLLTGVSCTGPGSCVAVGSYRIGPVAARAMGVAESHGIWGRAAGIPAPPGAVPSTFTGITSVSCAPRGPCLGVGDYAVSPSRDRAMTVTEARGRFGPAVPVTAVPRRAGRAPSTALSAVACPAARRCVAVGVGTDAAGHYVAMSAVLAAGHWALAFVPAPRDAATGAGQQSSLFSVACPGRFSCVAVGYYNDDSGGYRAEASAIG
jgi:hypothetical protein